jgi:hypothetical protein
MQFPHHDDRAPESERKRYLDEASSLLSEMRAPRGAGPSPPPGTVSEDFEHLRWFDLPAASLARR